MAEFSIFSADPAAMNGYGWEGDGEILTLGTEFYATADAWVTALRYPHVMIDSRPSRKTMALFDEARAIVVGPIQMPVGTPGQWNSAPLAEPFKLVPNARYRVATFYPDGGYAATSQYFHPDNFGDRVAYGPITAPSGLFASGGTQGSFKYASDIQFPEGSFNNTAYYSDVVVSDVDPATVVPAANIFGADGAAYTAHALINGTLVPVTLTP